MSRRRAGVALVLVLVTVLIGSIGPAVAGTGADAIGVSADGYTWHANLDRPLFDPAIRWVPGDERRAAFSVRNQGPTGASLSVSARIDDPGRLHATGHVVLQIRQAAGAWRSLPTSRTGATLGQLARHAHTRLTVRARFVGSSRNPTMRRSVAVDLTVRLSQGAHDVSTGDVSGSAGGRSGGSGLSSALPDTGAPRLLPALALALLLLVGGAAVSTRSSIRSRRKDLP